MASETDDNRRVGGRKKGSANLPKFALVPLEALTSQLKPDAMIPVDKDYAKGIMLAYNAANGNHDEDNQNDEEDNTGIVGMVIKDFSKKPEEM